MDLLALAGLAGVLLVKEAGVPIPVPGDLLVIGAGAALAGDPALAVGGLLLILVMGYVGGSVQFLLMKRALRGVLLAALARVGVPRARIEALAERLRRTGARGVAISRMTPGVRVGSIAASGLAAVPYPSFLRGLVIGNGVFVSGHFALGFVVGTSTGGLGADGLPLGMIAVAVIGLAILGAVGWALIHRRRRGGAEASAVADWTDAGCPACLAVAAARAAWPADRERPA
jgi:membrane protein DedA with SNARE-associated domain